MLRKDKYPSAAARTPKAKEGPQARESTSIGLKKGEMDKVPVQSPAGFHVVKVEDVRPAELYPKYEARKEELRHILLQRKVQAFIHEQVLRAEVKDAK